MTQPARQPEIERLRNMVQHAAPWLEIQGELLILGEGFASAALVDRFGHIVLAGKVAETRERYALIAQVAPRLAGHLPAPIPVPVALVEPGPGWPGGALVYRKLPGRPLCPGLLAPAQLDRLAGDLARFLRALHGYPLALARSLGIPEPDRRDVEATVIGLWPALRKALSGAEMARLERWWRALRTDDAFWNAPRTLCHGDFWHENLLVDERDGRLTGVIDLENLMIGDGARDLATLRHLDDAFASNVSRRYEALGAPPREDIGARMQRYWELREFGGLAFALRYSDRAEWEDGLRKLRAGPILSGTGERPSPGTRRSIRTGRKSR